METSTIAYIAAALGVAALAHRLQLRLELSAAKHPSLAGHSRLARRMAALVPHYEYDESEFFGADDAPAAVAEQRRAGFMRLAAFYSERYATTAKAHSRGRGRDLRSAVHRAGTASRSSSAAW